MDLLTATQVRQLFGGITKMTLWRWMNDQRVGFPEPVVINKRRYFRRIDIEAFQVGKAAQSAGSPQGAAA